MKRGFTLIELLVVIGMIAILTGAASSAVMKARRRSQIARAETEVREMTNAILAYENWNETHTLADRVTSKEGADAKEENLDFILGGVREGGKDVPVLYNGAVAGGYIRDPWGKPYKYMIVAAGKASEDDDNVGKGLKTFMYSPNLRRLTKDERE